MTVKASLKHHPQPVSLPIPHQLELAIRRIQVNKELTWEGACLEAAKILENFDRKVKAEAERLYKAKFFEQMNKARKSIYESGYKKGYDEGYKDGYNDAMQIEHFSIPCPICGEPMIFKSDEDIWETEIKPKLIEAFSRWRHKECLEIEREGI